MSGKSPSNLQTKQALQSGNNFRFPWLEFAIVSFVFFSPDLVSYTRVFCIASVLVLCTFGILAKTYGSNQAELVMNSSLRYENFISLLPRILVLFASAVLIGSPAFAQDVDFDSFEEYRPDVKEVESGSIPVSGRATGNAAEVEGKSLKPVETRERAQPAAAPAMKPIATPPNASQLSQEGKEAVEATRSVNLPSSGLSADADFRQNLQDLENRIESLKERVIETKARLLSYSQKVAKGFAAGTQVTLKINNNFGKKVLIEKASVYLDGHLIFTKEFDLENPPLEVDVYQGSVLPGRHRVDVELLLKADNGLFDFGHSVSLSQKSGEYFNANEGKVLQVDLDLFDRGGAFTAPDERPGIRFDIEERDVF
jgi:hypothetical protein